MCYCTPTIRTPWCGKKGCEAPHAAHCKCPRCVIVTAYPYDAEGTTVTLKPPARYLLGVESKVGGHYGEEQWTETRMSEHEDGEWVKWADVKTLFTNVVKAPLRVFNTVEVCSNCRSNPVAFVMMDGRRLCAVCYAYKRDYVL